MHTNRTLSAHIAVLFDDLVQLFITNAPFICDGRMEDKETNHLRTGVYGLYEQSSVAPLWP